MVNHFGESNVDLGSGIKIDEKIAKNIKLRMHNSKILDLKVIQALQKLKELKKDLKVFYEISELFEKRAFEEVISSSKYFLFFEAKFKYGRIIY